VQSHLIILHFHVKAILCGRKLRELLACISSQFPRFWHYNPRWPTILRALANEGCEAFRSIEGHSISQVSQ